MTTLTSVQFTQSNLQDFVTCQRRFELRYVRRLNWPAVESAPIHEAERRMQLGSDFHRLIHQHVLGLPETELTATAQQIAALTGSPELPAMWQNYLTHRPPELSIDAARFYPELTLSTLLAGQRLTAKFDLVAAVPGEQLRFLIVDWKTASKRPTTEILRRRIQSRAYPFVLASAGATLNQGQPINPDQITMIYWFSGAPGQPEQIRYNQAQYNQDEQFLSELIATITAATDFPLTDDHKACAYCVYRSYCDRGQVAGPLDDLADDLEADDLTLDWEQISEIAY